MCVSRPGGIDTCSGFDDGQSFHTQSVPSPEVETVSIYSVSAPQAAGTPFRSMPRQAVSGPTPSLAKGHCREQTLGEICHILGMKATPNGKSWSLALTKCIEVFEKIGTAPTLQHRSLIRIRTH